VISARWRATLLLYGALQFVALTTIAMLLYPDGYRFAHNFFSDLGGTHTWSGAPNRASMVLFSIALGSLGVAFVLFAGAWRGFAFARGRARWLGITAQLFGTVSGLAFVAVAFTPVDLALAYHNGFVLTAFGALLAYAAALVAFWWRNGASVAQRAAGGAYVLIVCAYVALVAVAVSQGVTTERAWVAMVVAQKVVAYVSMLYIAYIAVVVRAVTARTTS
jgi:hypothetical protein